MGITHGILIRAVNKAAYVDENNTVGIGTTNMLREDTPDIFTKEPDLLNIM